MTFRDVVRRDSRNAFRTRSAVSTFVVVLAATVVPAYLALRHLDGTQPTALLVIFAQFATEGTLPSQSDIVVLITAIVLGFVLPLVAVLVSYNAILVEREQGTIKLLLGLPNSRRDVIVGKVVARSLVVLAPLYVGVVAVAAVFAAMGDGVPAGKLAGLAALATALVVCFVVFGVTISAVTRGGRRAVALALGSYLLFGVFWRILQFGGYVYDTGSLSPPEQYYPEWFYATSRSSPIWAFEAATGALLDPGMGHPLIAAAPAGTLYTNHWLPVGSLLGLIAVCLLVSYLSFDRIDLG